MKIKLYLNKQVEVDLNLIEFLKGCFNQRDCNYDDVHFSPLHNCITSLILYCRCGDATKFW